ncbi:MAG: 5-formyltetrahydrofolate cyclo-ligase [Deltaproteobacteria bacterium]|nr:5-formyltetrahydrofolate cyclo-ligase [Deltaproteobacteria bacterium]
MKALLTSLGSQERDHFSRKMAERLLSCPEIEQAQRILTCLSFGAEPDTWRLLETLIDLGKEVYVPRADPRGSQLHVYPYPCELTTLSFGLKQPIPTAREVPPKAIDATLDAALLLGLAFDRRGFRLGYGRGYFDRFLQGRAFPAIGLAFHCQLLDRVPSEVHDLPVALVVTEEEVVRGGLPAGNV